MNLQALDVFVDAVLALAIIGAASTLLALHDVSEPTAIALYGVAVTLVGGSAKALLALHVPAPERPTGTLATSEPAPAPATAP